MPAYLEQRGITASMVDARNLVFQSEMSTLKITKIDGYEREYLLTSETITS